MNPKALLKDYLNKQHMMQLATINAGKPWACTVYIVCDASFNLYWASLPTRKHSQDIKSNPCVAAAIAVDFVNGEKVVGLQLTGTASELEVSPNNKSIAELYAKRFNRDNQWVEDFVDGSTQHKLYKLTPSAIYLFDEVNFPGGQKQKVL